MFQLRIQVMAQKAGASSVTLEGGQTVTSPIGWKG